MKYTLIAYRSDHADYCRGCVMGTSVSDLQIFYSESPNEIIDKMAELNSEYYDDNSYADYEYTLVIDGIPYSVDTGHVWLTDTTEQMSTVEANEKLMYEIMNEAKERTKKQVESAEAIKRYLAEQEKIRQKKEQEKRDRKEYDRLHKILYGDAGVAPY